MSLAAIKRSALSVLVVPGATQVFRPFMRDRATVFMLHRFDDARERPRLLDRRAAQDTVVAARTPLSADLARRAGGFTRARRHAEPRRRVHDRRRVRRTGDGGRSRIRRVRLPVTTFLTTGFIDGLLWLWWDRVDYMFSHTKRLEISLDVGGRPFVYRWSNDVERFAANADFVARCKRMPDAQKNASIARLAMALDVEVPRASA